MKFNLQYYARKVLGPPLYYIVSKLANIFGVWRYPADRGSGISSKKILNRMYWHHKRTNPIIKPEKGSELEAYFSEKRRQIEQPHLPEGFQGERSVSISAVGDLMNAKGIENSEDKFYAKVKELIFNADISIANLESTLTSGKVVNTGLQINATPKQFNAFKGHKGEQYTVFCTANNHMLDRGMEGFNSTHDRLEAEGFYYVGTNRSPEAQKKGLIIDSNGLKFGLVAATYQNNRPVPDGKNYLVNVIPIHRFRGKVELSLLEDQISYCRSMDCDFIIASLHWGLEFEFFPRQYQLEIAHRLIESGADAIVSHHTHNIQPYEFYQTRRDPHRKAPIFYGLGNLSSLWSTPYLSLSLIANFEVVKGQVNDVPKTLLAGVRVTPVLQMQYDYKKTPYLQIEKLSDLIRSARSKSRSEYINEAGRYADFVLGQSWRN
jgi:poly-gamma-glutamate synthesis protein (capsule biosynthesis protein)